MFWIIVFAITISLLIVGIDYRISKSKSKRNYWLTVIIGAVIVIGFFTVYHFVTDKIRVTYDLKLWHVYIASGLIYGVAAVFHEFVALNMKKIILNIVIALIAVITIAPIIWVVTASFIEPSQAPFLIERVLLPERIDVEVSDNVLTMDYRQKNLFGVKEYTFGAEDAGKYVLIYYSKRDNEIVQSAQVDEFVLDDYSKWMVYMQLDESGSIIRSTIDINSKALLNLRNILTFSNYKDILWDAKFRAWLANSFIVALSTALLSVILGFFAGYSFSRWKFPGRKTGLMWVMTTQLFPLAMMIVPFYILAAIVFPEVIPGLKILDTRWGLIMVYLATTLPFAIWMLKGYFDTIPIDLEEAALIDGAQLWQLLFFILLPITRPAIFTAFLFSFVKSWNEYAVSSVFLTDPDKITLPIGLQSLMGGGQDQNISWFAAGAVIVSVPVVILFLSMKKELVEGATMGAVKG